MFSNPCSSETGQVSVARCLCLSQKSKEGEGGKLQGVRLQGQQRVGAWTEISWEWYRLAWHMAVAVLLGLQDDSSHTAPWQNKISVWLLFCLTDLYTTNLTAVRLHCKSADPDRGELFPTSLFEGAATNQCNFKPPSLIISNNGGTTKILGKMFRINFNPLCSWFNHLFLPFYCGPSPTCFYTHGPDIWTELHLLSSKDWNCLTCPSACRRPAREWITCWELRWHLSMPPSAVGMAGTSRPNNCLPVVTTKGSQKVNHYYIHCSNRFKLLERDT